jgi:hypothetical protein
MNHTLTYLIAVSKENIFLCLIKHNAKRTYGKSGGIAPRVLNLGRRCRRVVSFKTRLLPFPGERSPIPTLEENGWAPELVWML